MLIEEISEKECRDLLANATVARLGCSLDNQPYVVPVVMTYEADYIYFFSTLGKKNKVDARQSSRLCAGG